MADVRKEILLVFKAQFKQFQQGFKDWKKDLTKGTSAAKKMGQTVGNLTHRFQGWALSILFAGMIIERTFTNILKSTLNTFLKITEGTTETSRGIIRLKAEWEFLKFTVGKAIAQALAPLIPYLVKIIQAIVQWVQKHPKLTAAIIFGAIALGLFFILVGQLVLGLAGLIGMFLFFLPIIKVFGLIFVGAIGLIGGFFASTVGVVILIIGLLVLAFLWLWNNVEGFRNFWIAVWGFIRDYFVALWEIIRYVFVRVWEAMKPAVMAFWNLLKSIGSMIMEFWRMVWEFVMLVFTFAWIKLKELAAPIVDWFSGTVFEPLKNAFKAAFDWVIDNVFAPFFNWIAKIIDKVRELVDWIKNKFSGAADSLHEKRMQIEKSASIPKKHFGGEVMEDGIYELKRGEKVTPSSGASNSFGNINITVNTTGNNIDASVLVQRLMDEINRRITPTARGS